MKYFTKIVDVMIKFMIPIVIIALLMGLARVVLDLRAVFGSETIAAGFDRMVTNILSMFIVIELLRSINTEFGLESKSDYANELLSELNRFLLAETAAGRTVVLVIDEAQTLEPDVLEQVRLISNLETENDKLIQIVLSGQPELEALLARPDLRQLNQRIAVRYNLHSLGMNETSSYIRQRMMVAGDTGGVSFSSSAVTWIYL